MTDDTQDIAGRLRNTPNWLREEFSHWKNCRTIYDRTPFEAADLIEAQAAEIERFRLALTRLSRMTDHFAGSLAADVAKQALNERTDHD